MTCASVDATTTSLGSQLYRDCLRLVDHIASKVSDWLFYCRWLCVCCLYLNLPPLAAWFECPGRKHQVPVLLCERVPPTTVLLPRRAGSLSTSSSSRSCWCFTLPILPGRVKFCVEWSHRSCVCCASAAFGLISRCVFLYSVSVGWVQPSQLRDPFPPSSVPACVPTRAMVSLSYFLYVADTLPPPLLGLMLIAMDLDPPSLPPCPPPPLPPHASKSPKGQQLRLILRTEFRKNVDETDPAKIKQLKGK